jgi:hypothetical protein
LREENPDSVIEENAEASEHEGGAVALYIGDKRAQALGQHDVQ